MYEAIRRPARRQGMGFDWSAFSNILSSGLQATGQILPGIIGGGNVTTLPIYSATGQYQTGGKVNAEGPGIFDEFGPLILVAGGALVLFLVLNRK